MIQQFLKPSESVFMSALENIKGKFKEFKPTSWAINNKTSVYLLIIFVTILGVIKFVSTPKEQFPDIVIPTDLCTDPLCREFSQGY